MASYAGLFCSSDRCVSRYYVCVIDALQDCSNFNAGSVMISAAKERKLDVTGVFGAVCKHGVPLKFLNMHHGERYESTTD